MALQFKRGVEAIAEAAEQKGGGSFRPFVPQIGWKDGDEKYVLFLNPLSEVPTVLLHEWVDCGTKTFGDKSFTDWGFFISRTDPAIGEDSDPLTEKGSTPKLRQLAVAVELEPILKDNGKGRKRPAGFKVATEEYTRKTDDGEETVTAPVIGVVTQAAGNFYNVLVAVESEGPVEETPLKIKRIGAKANTTYNMLPYVDQPVDLSELVNNVEGISYLSRDEEAWGELEATLEQVRETVTARIELNDELSEDDREQMETSEAAHAIAVAILEKRLNELADFDLYQEKTAHIEQVVDKFGGGDKKSSSNGRSERPQRQSQRPVREESEETTEPSRKRAGFDRLKQAAAAANS